MLCRGPAALIVASCMVVSLAAARGASAESDGMVTITAEFVVYERAYTADPDASIGAFDHHQVFHPGGVGPAGMVCSPDRIDVVTNRITLTFDPAGGPVVGSGELAMTCEYHPGCGAVPRTETLAFRGEYDPIAQLITGEVDAMSSGGPTTAWGDGPEGDDMCLESTWVQDPDGYTSAWLLDLEASLGYVTSTLCTDDPVKRIGWFTVTAGAGLAGPPVERVDAGDMATPKCATAGAITEPPSADEGAGPIPAPGVEEGVEEGVDPTDVERDEVQADDGDAVDGVADGDREIDTGSLSQTELFGLVVLILVTVGLAGWIGWAVVRRFAKVPSYDKYQDVTGGAGVLFSDGPTLSDDPVNQGGPATTIPAEPTPAAPDPGELGADHAVSVVLDLPNPWPLLPDAVPQQPAPPTTGEPGWEWHRAGADDTIGVADYEFRKVLAEIEPGQWYQTRPGPGEARYITLYDSDGNAVTTGVEVRPRSP